MTTGKSRRSHEEIVDAIIDVLPVRSDATVEEISRKAGCGWETADRWLDLIIYIQGRPRVLSSPRPSGPGEVYRRERQKHHKQEG